MMISIFYGAAAVPTSRTQQLGFFAGWDTNGDRGVWVTDGTSAGTIELRGSGGNHNGDLGAQGFASADGKVVFGAANGQSAYGLWVTDGTVAGTRELKVSGSSEAGLGFDPSNFLAFGSKVLFQGYDTSNVFGLWITDGTEAGTTELHVPGPSIYGFGDNPVVALGGIAPVPVVYGDKIVFTGANARGLWGLWVMDATAAATELHVAGADSFRFNPSEFTVVNGKVLFAGYDINHQSSLWVTDGTEAGTLELHVPGTGSLGFTPLDLTSYRGKALLSGNSASNTLGLWETDGTEAGTTELQVAATSRNGMAPYNFILYHDRVLFSGFGANDAYGLWVTDGTEAGTTELHVPTANSTGLSPRAFVLCGDKVLFSGFDPNDTRGLWVTDGTEAGTTELQVAGASSDGLSPFGFTPFRGKVLFQGLDASNGVGLWVTDGTAAGTTELQVSGVRRYGLSRDEITVLDVAVPVTPSQVTVLPMADPNGVTSLAMTSTELAQTVLQLQASEGTREIVLVDGALSLSPDTDAAFVARLYQTVLGRAPDAAGLGLWAAHLSAGAAEADVATDLLDSPEFTARGLAAQTDDQFLALLYQQALGRAPEALGAAGWSFSLQSGAASRADVSAGIAASIEAKQHWSGLTDQLWAPNPNADFVRAAYQTGLGRDAEAAGLGPWRDLLDGGDSWQDVARDVALAGEFLARHAGQTNEQFVTDLYRSGLGRAPEAAGLDRWVNALQTSSMTQGDVMFGIAASREAMTHLPHLL